MRLLKGLLVCACISGVLGYFYWRGHRHRHHRLHEALVVDAQGHASYLDHHNGRIYRYLTASGDYYTPSDYNCASPARISLPSGGRFTSSPATPQERALIESEEALAAQDHIDVEETVDAADDQIAGWDSEGDSIADDASDGGDSSGDAGGGSDSGGDAGDSGGGDGGGGDGGD